MMDESESSNEEEMPRCIVSDPAQPHNFSHRADEKIKHECTSCGEDELHRWLAFRQRDNKIHYYCTICDLEFHKICLLKPRKIIHPYHPQHPLVFTVHRYRTGEIAETSYFEYFRLRKRYDKENSETKPSTMFDICTWCGNDLKGWFYRCTICNFCLDFECASKFPPLTIQNPNSHHHSLTLFPRPLSFPCNACGLINVYEPSYACYQCNYVVHQSCIDLPRVIKITRHHHRLYLTPYGLPDKVLPCRICYKNVDIKYGQYSCNHEDCSYVAHSKCATHEKIWDGLELEWENEESDKEDDIAPYKKIGGGLIEHCWHENHYLKLEKYDVRRDLKKQCQACMRSIMSHDDFYSCIECDFFLHEVCANLPRKLNHALHKHPLFMEPFSIYSHKFLTVYCSACYRLSSGMQYSCRKEECVYKGKHFQVDVNCILVPEYSTHGSHADHSLFISTFGKDRSEIRCKSCKSEVDRYHLQCASCDFALCYSCATIPHEIYHKYDEDPLTLCYGEDGVDETYWCEVCERILDPQKWFYMNSERCTTIHRKCVFGELAYMKLGHTIIDFCNIKSEIVCNDRSSRHMCQRCHQRCPDPLCFKVYRVDGTEAFSCSMSCWDA